MWVGLSDNVKFTHGVPEQAKTLWPLAGERNQIWMSVALSWLIRLCLLTNELLNKCGGWSVSARGQVVIACLHWSVFKSAAVVGRSWSAVVRGRNSDEPLTGSDPTDELLGKEPVLSIRTRVFDASWFATYEQTERPWWLLPTSGSIKSKHVSIRTGLQKDGRR